MQNRVIEIIKKNVFYGLISRFYKFIKRINKFEDRLVEIIEIKHNDKNDEIKSSQRIWEPWNNIKLHNKCVIKISK